MTAVNMNLKAVLDLSLDQYSTPDPVCRTERITLLMCIIICITTTTNKEAEMSQQQQQQQQRHLHFIEVILRMHNSILLLLFLLRSDIPLLTFYKHTRDQHMLSRCLTCDSSLTLQEPKATGLDQPQQLLLLWEEVATALAAATREERIRILHHLPQLDDTFLVRQPKNLPTLLPLQGEEKRFSKLATRVKTAMTAALMLSMMHSKRVTDMKATRLSAAAVEWIALAEGL